ncbi:MAG TPA: TauD/TfdA family dioxygenase [Acidimicrobiia bacterium]|jgi:alpha-ketoglutarate-dependent taurine dioxygenase|nr:TauD/TfdA family dioxygenase [Acidimicrobiia bacterium]
MTVLTTEKLGATVGAEVLGVDRDRLLEDDAFPEWCLRVLDENGALVFRDLHLDDETQVAFSRKLGRVELVGRGDRPEIFRVTLDPAKNPVAEYLRGTFDWHLDGATDDIPIMATVLSAHAVAASGGETEFASTYAAYDALSASEQQELLLVRVVHSLEAAQRLVNPDPSPEEVATWRKRPAKVHPLVWQHRSGRRSLVLGATASHVEGMPFDEGRALLLELLDRSTAPELVYRHEWKVGDLVIWDNRGVLHRACRYDASSARDMHRTTIAGDEPIQ